MGCPVLCTCKMVQGSGRCHLESVGLCCVQEALSFPGEFCFAPVGFSAPVTACTAGAVVARSHSLWRKSKLAMFYYQRSVLMKCTGAVNIISMWKSRPRYYIYMVSPTECYIYFNQCQASSATAECISVLTVVGHWHFLKYLLHTTKAMCNAFVHIYIVHF